MNFALEENLKLWVEEQATIYGVSQTGFISMVLMQFKLQQNTVSDMEFLAQKVTEIQEELQRIKSGS